MSIKETQLTGGNMSSVFTDGGIIYKDRKPQSTTIQKLLLHLENKGVLFCSRALGFDEANREMLSYVKGITIEDYPQTHSMEIKIDAVKRAATMLREFHNATISFAKQEDDIWFLHYDGDLPKEVICHNDFAPYNVTFENNIPVGLIDFDTACPAPRVWDIAYAVYRFVPLSKSVFDINIGSYRDYDDEKDCEERKILLNMFLSAYGYNDNIGDYVVRRLLALVSLFDDECGKANPVFIKMKHDGHQDFYIREVEFVRRNIHKWL